MLARAVAPAAAAIACGDCATALPCGMIGAAAGGIGGSVREMPIDADARACAMLNHDDLLRMSGPIHAIDPFKVPKDDAVDKARALAACRSPFVLVASTDFDERFDLAAYIDAIRATGLRVVTHFPPDRHGKPRCLQGSDAMLNTAVLNSSLAAFRDVDALHAAVALDGPACAIIRTVAVTFGEDAKSRQYVGAEAVPLSEDRLDALLRPVSWDRTDALYLFCRSETPPLPLVARATAIVPAHVALFVSGRIGTRRTIDALLQAGARFPVIGTALEGADWRERMPDLM